MSLPNKTPAPGDIMEQVIIKGDLSKLSPEDRVRYYQEVCRSLGLNPLTRPFEYITLNGKLQLYALRACADQLRQAKRASWRNSNPRGLFARVVAANHTSSESEQKEQFWREIRESEVYLRNIVEWFCDAQLGAMRSRRRPAGTPTPVVKAIEKLKTKLTEHIQQEAETILLDIEMPNGKPLRLCTGHECTKFGGLFTAIGRRAGAKQVGAVLSEAALRSLWKKNKL